MRNNVRQTGSEIMMAVVDVENGSDSISGTCLCHKTRQSAFRCRIFKTRKQMRNSVLFLLLFIVHWILGTVSFEHEDQETWEGTKDIGIQIVVCM